MLPPFKPECPDVTEIPPAFPFAVPVDSETDPDVS